MKPPTNALKDHFGPEVWRVIYRLADQWSRNGYVEKDDLIQEAAIKAQRIRETVESPCVALYQTSINNHLYDIVTREWRRGPVRTQAPSSQFARVLEATRGDEARMDYDCATGGYPEADRARQLDSELRIALGQVADRLQPDTRRTFLIAVEGDMFKPCGQPQTGHIAEASGRSQCTVRRQIKKARRILARRAKDLIAA